MSKTTLYLELGKHNDVNWEQSLVTEEVTLEDKELLNKAESIIIEFTLAKYRYNQVKTALALNISRGTLRNKLKLYFGTKYIS